MKKIRYNKSGIMVGIGVVLIITSVTTMLWFFLRGETKVASKNSEIVNSASISCSAENYNYPFFTYDSTSKTATEVNIVFNSNNIGSISLIHKMFYDDNSKANASSATNHAAMNESFGSELGADALGANYNVSDGTMRASFYASGSDYNDSTRKYFLIDSPLKTMKQYKKNYTDKGFKCTEKTN